MPRRLLPALLLLAACGPSEVEDTVVGDVRGADLMGVAVPVDEPVGPETPEAPDEGESGDDGSGEVEALAPIEAGSDRSQEPAAASHAFGDAEKPAPKGSQRVTFAFLSDFFYIPSDVRDEFDDDELGEAVDEIPERVQAFRGKTITVDGFMMPTEVDDDQNTRRLVLMRDVPGCCFASVPPINGWIDVRVHADEELEYVPYMIVEATGTFDCGEEVKDGVVLSLYRMTDARVREAND